VEVKGEEVHVLKGERVRVGKVLQAIVHEHG
jgi:hypothetical protein